MYGYDCRNKYVFSFWRNVVSDGADWTSSGRLFQSWASSSKRAIADSDTPRRADVEKTGGWRAQPASTSRRQISDVLQPVWQVLRCSAVKSSVDNDRQCELDERAVWRVYNIYSWTWWCVMGWQVFQCSVVYWEVQRVISVVQRCVKLWHRWQLLMKCDVLMRFVCWVDFDSDDDDDDILVVMEMVVMVITSSSVCRCWCWLLFSTMLWVSATLNVSDGKYWTVVVT